MVTKSKKVIKKVDDKKKASSAVKRFNIKSIKDLDLSNLEMYFPKTKDKGDETSTWWGKFKWWLYGERLHKKQLLNIKSSFDMYEVYPGSLVIASSDLSRVRVEYDPAHGDGKNAFMKIEYRTSKYSSEWKCLEESDQFKLNGKGAGKTFNKVYTGLIKRLKNKAESKRV